MQHSQTGTTRVVVITVLTAALKQAMADYSKLRFGAYQRNELQVYADHGTIVFPGVGGHVEIHDALHEGRDQFAIADRDQFFRLVKLTNGMYTSLTYMPHNERMILQCSGLRFTVFAEDVDERLNLPSYISSSRFDADLTMRLAKAVPFATSDEVRPALNHVFYNRKLDMIGATDGFQLYIENDQRIDENDRADVAWVSRSLLRQVKRGDVLELGEGFECLLRKHGVYVFSQRMSENPFGFENMRSVHRAGWKYTRFVLRAKAMLGPLQRYLRVTSNYPPLWLAVNGKHALLLQPFNGDDKKYLNYIAVEQPDDLAVCDVWDNLRLDVEPPTDRYVVCLNADYLARALRVLGGDVIVAQRSHKYPVVLVSAANPNVWCNIMPMHFIFPGRAGESPSSVVWSILDAEVPHGDF